MFTFVIFSFKIVKFLMKLGANLIKKHLNLKSEIKQLVKKQFAKLYHFITFFFFIYNVNFLLYLVNNV